MLNRSTLNAVISHILSLVLNSSKNTLIQVYDVLSDGTNYIFLYDDKVVMSMGLDECTSIIKLLSMSIKMSCVPISTEYLLHILLKVYLLLTKLDCTSENFMSLTSFSEVSNFVESTDFSVDSVREYVFGLDTCKLAYKDAKAVISSYGMEGNKEQYLI